MQKIQHNSSPVNYIDTKDESLVSKKEQHSKTLYVTIKQRNTIFAASFSMAIILAGLFYFISPTKQTGTIFGHNTNNTNISTTVSQLTKTEIALHEISIFETIEKIGIANLPILEEWRYKNFSTDPMQTAIFRSAVGDKLFYNILYIKKLDNEIKLLRLRDSASQKAFLLSQLSIALKHTDTKKENSISYQNLEQSLDDIALEITRVKETIYYQQEMLSNNIARPLNLPLPPPLPADLHFPLDDNLPFRMPHPILPPDRVSLDEVEGRLPNMSINNKNQSQKTIPASDLLLSE